MRITNRLTYDNLQQNIGTSLENLNQVQRSIATGKKLTTFSDDPAGASQALADRSALADNAQYQRDADQAKLLLSTSDSALSSASDIIRSARTLAVQGANSAQTPDQFAALGTQVDGLIQQLTQVANTDLHGKYVFGGTQTNVPPFDAAQTYHGNAGALTATIGPGYQVTLNQPGSTVFGAAFTALQTLKTDLAAGNVTAISSDIGQVDKGITAISTARASVGTKINEVTSAGERLTRAQNEYQDAISKIEDVDLSQAYVQLQSAQNIYQASLSTTAKAFQYSLTDYLH